MYFLLRKKRYEKVKYLVSNKRKIVNKIKQDNVTPKILNAFRHQTKQKMEHSLKVFRIRNKSLTNFFAVVNLQQNLKTHEEYIFENDVLNRYAKLTNKFKDSDGKYVIHLVNKILKKQQKEFKKYRRRKKFLVKRKKINVY